MSERPLNNKIAGKTANSNENPTCKETKNIQTESDLTQYKKRKLMRSIKAANLSADLILCLRLLVNHKAPKMQMNLVSLTNKLKSHQIVLEESNTTLWEVRTEMTTIRDNKESKENSCKAMRNELTIIEMDMK